VIAGGVALLTVGGSSAQQAKRCAGQAGELDAEGLLSPVAPAPPLALRNYLGQPVNIDSYRGKAVLVTFLYTNCPDICPLITSNLRVALNLMGPRSWPPKCRSSPCRWIRAGTRRRRSRRSWRAMR
jgi:cytochrome oxidase Cu insertion factor (SCO1/SenC/PrrC family)